VVSVSEVAGTDPVQVVTTDSVGEAMGRMVRHGVDEVIVTDPAGGRMIGLLTAYDVAARVVGTGLDPAVATSGEICTYNATTVRASDELSTAMALMRERGIRRIPVLDDDDGVVRVLSIEDLAASSKVKAKDLRDILRAGSARFR
jgi:CBS domain-containing protein